MIFVILSLVTQLNKTSCYMDVPTMPVYNLKGMFGVGLCLSFPMYKEDPNPNDDLEPDGTFFNMVFRYGLSRGEVSLSMYSLSTFSVSGKYVLTPEQNNKPGFFVGMDNVSYYTHLSSFGGGGRNTGSLEEKSYTARPWELFSFYGAMQKTFKPFDFVIGLGRGRYVGYGWRSHYFNTDLFIVGDDYTSGRQSFWALGLFAGGAIRLPGNVALLVDMNGRDAALGIRQTNKYVTFTLGLNKVEYLGNFRPWSPRWTFGLEGNNRFILEGVKYGSIECVVQDITSKTLLPNSVIDIKETNKRFRSIGGTFNLSLPVGAYTITVTKPDYVDYIAKITIKEGVKSKLVFNLKKTEEALRREAAAVEREKNIKTYLQQGTIYYSEGNLDEALKAFNLVLSLDPDNADAKNYVANIDQRRVELIASYSAEAKARTVNKEYAKAIEFWQKVLKLDPNNAEAKTAIDALRKQLTTVKPPATTPTTKPPTTPPKTTKEDIEALYNKGINLFTAEKYDDALKAFNQVLALDPNHQGAKNYKKRTEARIKALKGG